MNRTDKLISGMQSITRVLWSAAALLAPWLVPLAPASFFGWSLYQTAGSAGMPRELAVGVGIVAALGLEAVNIAAAHAALHLSHQWEKHQLKFGVAIGLIVVYVTVGVIAVLMLNVPLNTQIIGVAMFALAPVAITAQALTLDLARVREETDARQARDDDRRRLANEDRQAERALKDKELDLQFAALQTEQVKARAAARIAKAQAGTERPEQRPEHGGTDSVQARAEALLERTPDLSGDALGLILGVSGGYGRKLKRAWLADDRNGKQE
jgi:hypothetical protein